MTVGRAKAAAAAIRRSASRLPGAAGDAVEEARADQPVDGQGDVVRVDVSPEALGHESRDFFVGAMAVAGVEDGGRFAVQAAGPVAVEIVDERLLAEVAKYQGPASGSGARHPLILARESGTYTHRE